MSSFIIASRHVFDATKENTSACALLIEDGRIKAVYPYEQLAELDAHYPVIDCKEKLITPGLHDAHQHVMHAALFPSALADEYQSISLTDCLDRLVAFSERAPKTGWLMSHGWRDNLWTDGKKPHKKYLDELFSDRPVALYSGDSHTLWLNSEGLKQLGITNETKPPAGGSFDRDECGSLTGVLREAAGMKYVAMVLDSFDAEVLQRVYQEYFERLLSFGITSVSDMAISLIPGADGILPHVYAGLLKRHALKLRACVFPTLTEDMSNLDQVRACFEDTELVQEANRFGAQETVKDDVFCNMMLQAPGFKQFFDGVSSQHTAWVSEDYTNARFLGDRGHPTVDPARMKNLVLKAAQQGNAVRIHAIGDKAVATALDIFEESQRQYGRPRFGVNTIEHVEDCIESDRKRFSLLGVVASVQPPHITIDVSQPLRDLGYDRSKRMWALKSMQQEGITLAFGTDAPVVGPSSLDVLWCALTRSHPETHEPQAGWFYDEALTRPEALRAYTQGSAEATGRSADLGTLEAGKLADLVVWDTNLLTCDISDIQKARPECVYVGGACVWKKEEKS